MPNPRPQTSIFTLLLLFVIVALSIFAWKAQVDKDAMQKELTDLIQETERLREEAGVITVTDPTKIHAIQLTTDAPLTWKWRVFIPANRTVAFSHQAFKVPAKAFTGKTGHEKFTGPREVVVVARIEKCSSKLFDWRSAVECCGGLDFNYIPKDSSRWLDNGGAFSVSYTGVAKTVSVETVGSPLLLLRMRNDYDGKSFADKFADGLIVWVSDSEQSFESAGSSDAG